MVDVTPPAPPADRIEPVGLEVEMQRSYLDYAMSVIVGRALPSVQDGLKPVHRRVLYAMYDGGYRPDRGYVKCSRVVGDVMGNYHPHGDTPIYDTLVRLAQPWSMRVPLVDGNGNFGSQGDDPAAAMRYCVTGDTVVRLADGSSRRIADLAAEHGVTTCGEADVDMKVVGARGEPVPADKVFHSGDHPTLTLRTCNGLTVTGTHNHPMLVLTTDAAKQPHLTWKRLDEISAQDYVCALRTPAAEQGAPMTVQEEDLALLFGSWVSEGWYTDRAGFNNTDQGWFQQVEAAYRRVVGGTAYVYSRRLESGRPIFEMDVPNLTALDASPLAEMKGLRSADKRIPNWVWRASAAAKRRFLQALYEGDGSVSLLPRNSVQIAYSTKSPALAHDVQQLLLEFGTVSAVCQDTRRPDAYRTVITNRRDARIFAARVGFLAAKRAALAEALGAVPFNSRALSSDHVPYLAAWLRGTAPRGHREWLSRHNIDRPERWERDGELRNRLTPSALSIAESLADGTHYYAKVQSVTPASVAPVYSLRIANDEHAFITNGLVSHNTEARLAPLAMEMLREIDQDTVDFVANYDGRAREPVVLPSRFPNLLVNGSGGIAVGMATNIPPHNLREVAAGVQWALAHPEATPDELLDALLERVHGPDFPTAALIVGTDGISDAYRTGRGSIRMRAVVEVDEDAKGRTIIVVTELPYQVNKDSVLRKIKELVEDQRIGGIAELNDEGSARTGLRLVVTLKRDAIAKVVLNNLYKHTQLQDTFGANMLAIVDGVPRTMRLDEMVSYYVGHQVEVIVRRTRYQLRKAEERAHILRGLAKALDRLDDVIALIRRADSADAARGQLMALLDIDELQATAILDMQLRRLAALERQRLIDELAEREREIADLQAILADPVRQRSIISTELAEITDRYGDERRTRIVPFEGDMSLEDLIAQEDVVVTVTRGGYAKRTKTELYRSQRRGGRGVQGAALRQDDLVEHFFVTTTHHWILFLTNQGRVYRAKAHELPEQNRAARGQHVANILAFAPDEKIAQVLDIRDYSVAPYLVLATKRGLVKKTALTEFDNGRSSGLIAINLRADDELIAAQLTGPDDDLMLVSRSAQSIRFTADDESLRPMGRATSGVIGMRFNSDDELLSMEVVREGADLLIATDGGYAKRTRMQEYPQQGRGGKGVLTAKIVSTRGQLVGALMVRPEEEVFAITSSGGVIRTTAREVRRAQRQTMGVRLINLDEGVSVVSIARNAEPEPAVVDALVEGRDPGTIAADSSGAVDGDE